MKDVIASQTEASKVTLEKLQVVAKHDKLKEVWSERQEEYQRALVDFNDSKLSTHRSEQY